MDTIKMYIMQFLLWRMRRHDIRIAEGMEYLINCEW